MQNRRPATIAISALVAVSLLGCAGSVPQPTPTSPPPTSTSTPTATPIPPTPTPEAREPNYSSPSLGLALWYPATWIVDDMPEAVAFASSSELMSTDDWDTGAAFAVMLGELEDGQTIKELVREMLEESAFEAVETTELEPAAIADDRGVIVNLEATPAGASTTIKGFVAGVERNSQAYLFMGFSVK